MDVLAAGMATRWYQLVNSDYGDLLIEVDRNALRCSVFNESIEVEDVRTCGVVLRQIACCGFELRSGSGKVSLLCWNRVMHASGRDEDFIAAYEFNGRDWSQLEPTGWQRLKVWYRLR